MMIVYLGIGANVGDPLAACERAVGAMREIPLMEVVSVSSWYRTSPVGDEGQPDFVNGAAEIKTGLSPRGLLTILKNLEAELGRKPSRRWGPREIDLDILLYGQEVIREEGLTIPHPEMHRRRFVLVPLCEIAPYVIHPAFGVSVRGLLDRLDAEGRVEKIARGVRC